MFPRVMMRVPDKFGDVDGAVFSHVLVAAFHTKSGLDGFLPGGFADSVGVEVGLHVINNTGNNIGNNTGVFGSSEGEIILNIGPMLYTGWQVLKHSLAILQEPCSLVGEAMQASWLAPTAFVTFDTLLVEYKLHHFVPR